MSDLTAHEQPESTTGPEGAIVWVTLGITQDCFDEASAKYPLETGGTFMGWWSDTGTAVITAMIGPGPKAIHARHSFQPDQTWQLEQIAHHYAASGRRETYLGDWHSHPGAQDGSLSWIDRRVLRRVITTPSARCHKPLMCVIWGEAERWGLTTWSAQLCTRLILWDRLSLKRASVRYFTPELIKWGLMGQRDQIVTDSCHLVSTPVHSSQLGAGPACVSC